jgi:hypothetical protein
MEISGRGACGKGGTGFVHAGLLVPRDDDEETAINDMPLVMSSMELCHPWLTFSFRVPA